MYDSGIVRETHDAGVRISQRLESGRSINSKEEALLDLSLGGKLWHFFSELYNIWVVNLFVAFMSQWFIEVEVNIDIASKQLFK